MEELEAGEIEYKSAGEFLAEIRKEFGGGDEETGKDSRAKENQIRRKKYGRICTRVQESSKREWIQGMLTNQRIQKEHK